MNHPGMQVCRFPWPSAGYHGVHNHMPRPFWDEPELRLASWTDPYSSRCCEFCDIFEEIPEVKIFLHELSFYDPHHHRHIINMYDTIHAHYMLGYDRDGIESYDLSCEMEKFSRMFQKVYRRNPWSGRTFGDLASRLKCAGREVHIGPRRRRYHTDSYPRYRNGGYYPGDPWARRGWRY